MSIPSLDSYTVNRAAINFSSSGDNTLIAATAQKSIYVLSFFLIAGGTVTVTFQDGTAGTALTGGIPLVANTGVACAFNPVGWFTTSPGNLLDLNLNGNVQVSGVIEYILI